MKPTTYCEAILEAFNYLLNNHKEVFVLGQGLWSPWYVGNSMKDLDKKFGKKRIIDTPISENAVTGAAVGASLCGMKPIVVHPRMDFMLYAIDPIVNQCAKWSYMFGGQANPQLTIRSIINRGGEQGAQHSQLLHSWFAHIPGLRVVMPYSVSDARDLLIASVLCKDPVIYVDDRWLYDEEELLPEIKILELDKETPKTIVRGKDLTIVSSGYSTKLAKESIKELKNIYEGKSIELIDLRIINPIDFSSIIESVKRTGNLLVIDGGWKTCGLGSEIISSVVETIRPSFLKNQPINISLKQCPAPTSSVLEKEYYPSVKEIIDCINTKELL
jgi:pyruvate dehydrogenase E1 component beta subunit